MRLGHRYKSYAGDTGVTYQYFFDARRRVVRPEGQGPGSEYSFVVIADQTPPFSSRVFLADRALEAWHQAHGRALDLNEQYAAAKMRLFRAFDEHEHLMDARMNLIVDETNIAELLEALDLA